MTDIILLKDDWRDCLSDLLGSAKTGVVISSPFVTRDGVNFVLERIASDFHAVGQLTFVTNLSPTNQIQGITDPNALWDLSRQLANTTIYHLPRLHAKAYVSDTDRAIITSGNLTSGGLRQNYEYGVLITDSDTVSRIRSDIISYAQLGALVNRERLLAYCQAVDEAIVAFQRQQSSASHSARQHFEKALQVASDELIRLKLAEGPMHTVFERTVLFLLRQHGPLSTEELHPLVQQIHPDLCDDAEDRIIDGRHFGKRWKHAVRTSQQHLKKKGLIILEDGRWQVVSVP